jgi:hypothetical protein
MAEFSSRLPVGQDAQPDSGFTSKYTPVATAPEPAEPPAWEEIKQSDDYKKLTYPEQLNLARQWGDETKRYASKFEDHTPELDAQVDDFVNKKAVDVPTNVRVASGAAGLVKGAAETLGGIGGAAVGAFTGPAAPVAVPALAVGGSIAAGALAEKALKKFTPNVARAREFAPGYATAGELAPAVGIGAAGVKQLYTSGRTIFAELGAKKAAEEMGKFVAKGAAAGAGIGTVARAVTGGQITPGTIAEDALFGALYQGLGANTRVKGYNFNEFKDLNYKVKNGSATQAEFADWKNILNEAQNVGAKGVQSVERTTVDLGRKNVLDRTRFKQGEQPVEVKPYYEPLPSAPTTPSTEIELSRQPQARQIKPANVVTPEALPESGVRGNVRGTQADTAEMQRRGIPTNIQAEFTDLTPAAKMQNIFSVESQGINPDAIAPSTRGLQGEIVREGPIVTPRTQLPTTERLALPAVEQPIIKTKTAQTIPRPMGGAAGQGGFITSESFEVPKKLLQDYMTTNGALGKDLFDIIEGQKTNREAMYASIRFATRDVKNAFKLVNGRPIATPEQNKLISDYMSGDTELESLPTQLRAPVKILRNQLDTLSTKLMSEEGLLSERSKEIFSSNIGSYMNRSYEKHYNPNYDMATAQKRDPVMFAKGVEYVKNQMITEAKEEMEDYARRLQSHQDNAQPSTPPPLAPEPYIQQIYKTGNVPQDRLMGEVQRIIEEGSAKSGQAKPFNLESYGVSKKLGILKTRKAIPEEIRYLMGEYTDPLVRFTQSASKMVNLFTSHRTLVNLKEAGFRNGLFFDYPAPDTVAFASEGSEVLSPLNGVYMEKSIAEAIKGFDSAIKGDLVYKTFAKINAFYKWSKTVGSYKGQIRNFLFNIPIEVQNGNFTLLENGKSTKAILADFGIPQADTPAMRAYLRRAMALGVYNNAKFDELNAMLRDAHADGGSIASFVERYGVPKFISNPIGSIIDFANFAYRSGDNFYKLTAWENEIKQLMDGKGLSRQDAEIEAAERVSNTRPTYERLAPLLKKFRTSPFGKNFISWNAERIRNSYWTTKYAIEDMRTPGMRKYGFKRAIGSILAYSVYGAAVKIALSSLGKKKEDVDALKKFAPNYQKDSILMPISFDTKTHNVKYIDLSFSDPFDVYRQPINAFNSADRLDVGLFNATANLIGNFFGVSVPVDIAINMASNKRTNGQSITNPQASPQKKFSDYAEYALRSFEPSTVTDIRNLYFAIKGEPDPYLGKYGRMPSMTENISSYAGLRAQTINIDQALQFRASRFNDDIGKSTSLFTEKYMAPGKQNRLTMESGTSEMMQSREKLFKDMHETYLSALRWGLNSNDAIEAMRKGGMSRYNIMGVVEGKAPQFQIVRGMQRNLMYANPEDMQKRQEIANQLLQEKQ